MSNAYLCPILQETQFNDDGSFLVGGLIWTYAAGTTTPLTVYQDQAATTPWPNPIVLNSRGETGGEIWLIAGSPYKLILQSAPMAGLTNGTVISNFDNVSGVNDPSANPEQADWQKYITHSPIFLTATSFSILGDVTPIFTLNRRIKSDCTAGVQYGTVKTSVFDGTKTTVTAIMDVGSALDNGMSDVYYGFVETNPSSIPVAVLTGTSNSSSSHNIKIDYNGTNLTSTVDSTDFGANWPINISGSAGPTGSVIMFAANTPPAGYLAANGAAVSRSTYAALFAIIGTTFGSGDGSLTFNLPDLRGNFMRAWDNGRGIDSGRAFGSSQAASNGPISLTDPGHVHTYQVGTAVSNTYGGGSLPGTNANIQTPNTGGAVTGITVNGSGPEARPINIALLACIKY